MDAASLYITSVTIYHRYDVTSKKT